LEAFELRSGEIFATHYIDELPGRAPTRAVYRVRAISAAGAASPLSAVIGPVYVPDVRPPPAPNLMRVAATHPEEMDSAIAVEWGQAALDTDTRFEIEIREAGSSSRFTTAGTVPRGTPPVNGRFRFIHPDRVPGRRYEYRVIAVREALDPIDSSGSARRAIRSIPSPTRIGFSTSALPLAPPFGIIVEWNSAANSIHLSWTNAGSYDTVAIHRRAPDRYGFERQAELDGMSTSFQDPALASGTWAYELRARSASREARSTITEVTVP
jgi:hypothetical protein